MKKLKKYELVNKRGETLTHVYETSFKNAREELQKEYKGCFTLYQMLPCGGAKNIRI